MADNITFQNTENKSDASFCKESSGCQLCLEKNSKYTCPRCNVRYCSVECYRCEKHLTCSEMFYKKCVFEALKDEKIDQEGKQRMLAILKRHKETQESYLLNDESENDLEQRLEGLNLDQDTEKIWERLTEVEKREFEKAVDNGHIGSLVDIWVPWWVGCGQRYLNDESHEKQKNNENGTLLPKLLKNIPHLQSLIKSKQPSPDTKYNLINILYSYAYICRFYNGCHYDFVQVAVQGLWKLSAVLCHTVNFSSLDCALRSSVELSQLHHEYFSSEEFSLTVIDDVSLLMKESEEDSNNHLAEHALSDIYKLLAKGVELWKSDKGSAAIHKNEESKNIAKSLWHAKKKVYFMLAWFCENQDVCLSLQPFLQVVKENLKTELKQIQNEKILIEKSRMSKSSRKKLIEEI